MNNFKNVEKLMTKQSRQSNPQYAAAYENLMKVYRFIDNKDGGCHCKIINALYNATKRYSLFRISQDMNISDNALRRYRQSYAAWFCYFQKEALQ